ncbi:MAG: chitobiase/beta-hexosaminidase C-terminal domain-containing protein [Nitrospinae bacterium]|nr:chitobiase/beta-hexosaminidase C-terminal domain-containing protein [Nitrospinota bacterium]
MRKTVLLVVVLAAFFTFMVLDERTFAAVTKKTRPAKLVIYAKLEDSNGRLTALKAAPIYVNEELKGKGSVTLPGLDAGNYRVNFGYLKGYEVHDPEGGETVVNLQPGKSKSVIGKYKAGALTAAQKGTLNAQTVAGKDQVKAPISIDGAFIGTGKVSIDLEARKQKYVVSFGYLDGYTIISPPKGVREIPILAKKTANVKAQYRKLNANEIDATAPTTKADPTPKKGEVYNLPVDVGLTCADPRVGKRVTSGCEFTYYTDNGKEPTNTSTVYTDKLTLTTSKTLKFFSVDYAGNAEKANTVDYTVKIVDKIAPITAVSKATNATWGTTKYTVASGATTLITLGCTDTAGTGFTPVGCKATYYQTTEKGVTSAEQTYDSTKGITLGPKPKSSGTVTLTYYSIDKALNKEVSKSTTFYFASSGTFTM